VHLVQTIDAQHSPLDRDAHAGKAIRQKLMVQRANIVVESDALPTG
jgi:hypothetical protein